MNSVSRSMLPTNLPPGVQSSETFYLVPHFHITFMVFSALFVLAFNLFLLWLLHRHRKAFRIPPAADPPAPIGLA
jgi:flagellar biogenesis protein FliO